MAPWAGRNRHKAEGPQKLFGKDPLLSLFFLLPGKIILKRRTLFTYLLIYLCLFILISWKHSFGTQRNNMFWGKSYLVSNDAFKTVKQTNFFFLGFLDLVFRKVRQKKRSYGLLGADLGTEGGWKGSLEGTGTKELN